MTLLCLLSWVCVYVTVSIYVTCVRKVNSFLHLCSQVWLIRWIWATSHVRRSIFHWLWSIQMVPLNSLLQFQSVYMEVCMILTKQCHYVQMMSWWSRWACIVCLYSTTGIPWMFCTVSCLYTSTGPPSAPQNFQLCIADDLRPEFYGHAILTLKWDTPEGIYIVSSTW